MTTANEVLAAISSYIDHSPGYTGIDPEAVDWRRISKAAEEVGEAIEAYAGTRGENPRKGTTHTMDDVDHELLDVVVSGLGALMHFHGNDPTYDVMAALADHIRTRADRFGIAHEPEDPEDFFDGYHTVRELYRYRLLYNAGLFNEWALRGLYDVHKSKLHDDGTVPFGNPDLFKVTAKLPTGQISNHYSLKHWSLFKIPERERSAVWDGSTAAQVADSLARFLGEFQ